MSAKPTDLPRKYESLAFGVYLCCTATILVVLFVSWIKHNLPLEGGLKPFPQVAPVRVVRGVPLSLPDIESLQKDLWFPELPLLLASVIVAIHSLRPSFPSSGNRALLCFGISGLMLVTAIVWAYMVLPVGLVNLVRVGSP